MCSMPSCPPSSRSSASTRSWSGPRRCSTASPWAGARSGSMAGRPSRPRRGARPTTSACCGSSARSTTPSGSMPTTSSRSGTRCGRPAPWPGPSRASRSSTSTCRPRSTRGCNAYTHRVTLIGKSTRSGPHARCRRWRQCLVTKGQITRNDAPRLGPPSFGHLACLLLPKAGSRFVVIGRSTLHNIGGGYMRNVMKIGVLLPVAGLLVSRFATEGFVRAMVAQKERESYHRIVEVEGQVEGVNTQGKGGTTQGESLEGAVADARSRADAAMTKAEGVDTRLSRLWSNRYNQKTADTLEVYFGFDKAELTDGAQTALLGVIKELQGNPTLVVELGGYTDPKGTVDYNYGLSQRRVEAGRRFPGDKGVALSRGQQCGP